MPTVLQAILDKLAGYDQAKTPSDITDKNAGYDQAGSHNNNYKGQGNAGILPITRRSKRA